MSTQTISPNRLYEVYSGGRQVQLIDVRTPAEFQAVHIGFAHNSPLDQLSDSKMKALCSSDEPLYVVCRSGGRSKKACEKLINAGCKNVVNVEGGTSGWEEAGLPVVRGKAVVSLERQVRITAGLLVVLGTALGLWVHPYWTCLATFVGAGLIFAGVTDTCGMAMLLARMPWNQVKKSSDTACEINTSGRTKCC